MTGQLTEVFSTDRAVKNPEEDLLGYAPFARDLASALARMAPPEGFVVAVEGEWGSGKTTLLEFVKCYLNRLSTDIKPTILEFNPWWFSSREDLTSYFFRELLAAARPSDSRRQEVIDKIAEFLRLVSYAPIPGIESGKKFAEWIDSRKKSLRDLKSSFSELLAESADRVVVIMDDVDRLPPDDVRELFRLVKAVADLPGIIYLLALDRNVVADMLSGDGVCGKAYLEKIIQMPVALPKPDRIALQRMLADKLSRIVGGKSKEFFDPNYWRDIYLNGIESFLKTPRDIVRLSNTLMLMHPIMEGEVNPVDFIAIEALRLFQPNVYRQIKYYPDRFAGYTEEEGEDELKAFHKDWLKACNESPEGPVGRVLWERMFPRFDSAFRNVRYDLEVHWRKQLRACSPDKLPVYFKFSLPEGEISRAELDRVMGMASDARRFGEALVEFARQKRPDGLTRAHQLLEQLEDFFRHDLSAGDAPSVLRAFLDVGDSLLTPEDAAGPLLMITNLDRVMYLIGFTLHRIDRGQRFPAIQNALANGNAICTMVQMTVMLGAQHSEESLPPDREQRRLFTEEELTKLKQEVCSRVREVAMKGTLLDSPHLAVILEMWREWDGESLSDWLKQDLQDEANLLRLLRGFIPDQDISLSEDPVADLKRRGYLKLLRKFVDISEYREQLEKLAADPTLTEKDRIRIKLVAEE